MWSGATAVIADLGISSNSEVSGSGTITSIIFHFASGEYALFMTTSLASVAYIRTFLSNPSSINRIDMEYTSSPLEQPVSQTFIRGCFFRSGIMFFLSVLKKGGSRNISVTFTARLRSNLSEYSLSLSSLCCISEIVLRLDLER